MVAVKKRKGSKNKKKAWRKTDIQDVENFLEDKRLEERLGTSFKNLEDRDLFSLDTTAEPKNLVKYETSKAQRRKKLLSKTPRCYDVLKSHSKVPDPLGSRNIRRNAVERQHPAARRKLEQSSVKGVLKKKDIARARSKTAAAKDKIAKRKEGKGLVTKDLWAEEITLPLPLASEWVNTATKHHVMLNDSKFKTTRLLLKHKEAYKPYKHDKISAVEVDQAGMSYNPSYEDHVKLLDKIARDEEREEEKNKRIKRLTVDMFSKVPVHEAEAEYLREMSQGIPELDPEAAKPDEPSENDGNANNVPVAMPQRKGRITRRNIHREKCLQSKIKAAKEARKREAEIDRVKVITNEILKAEEKSRRRLERVKKNKEKVVTKRLGLKRLKKRELAFNLGTELKGNLRSLKPDGNLLSDRYHSFQKRNMMEVTNKQLRTKVKHKKMFMRASHKIDLENHPLLKDGTPPEKKKKRRKGKTTHSGQD